MLTGANNEQKIWNYLTAAGLNACGAAGLMGNMYAESGLRPNNLQNSFEGKIGLGDEEYTSSVDKGTYKNFVHDSAGYGLAQWTYRSRKQALYEYAKEKGVSVGDLEMQLEFLVKELGQYGLLNTLKTAATVKDASNLVLLKFEKPASMNSPSTQAQRAQYGQTYYNRYAGNGTAAQTATPTTPTTGKKTSAAAVLAVAVSQIGYHEKATKDRLDDKTANAGSANWTKFARDFDEKYPNWYNGKKNGYAWCDMFVDWCFLTAFGYDAALKLLCQPEHSAGAGCTYSLMYYRQKGRFFPSDPQPGDQIFFGASQYNSTHTGIVERVAGGRVYTIEGNTSDMVARRNYALTYNMILGYGRPAYDEVSAAPVAAQTAGAAADAAKLDYAQKFDKSRAGMYRTTADLNLRAGASTAKAVLAVMPKGATVQNFGYYSLADDGTPWLYVQYAAGGKTLTGFCSSKYLTK